MASWATDCFFTHCEVISWIFRNPFNCHLHFFIIDRLHVSPGQLHVYLQRKAGTLCVHKIQKLTVHPKSRRNSHWNCFHCLHRPQLVVMPFCSFKTCQIHVRDQSQNYVIMSPLFHGAITIPILKMNEWRWIHLFLDGTFFVLHSFMPFRDGEPLYGKAFWEKAVSFSAIYTYRSKHMPVSMIPMYCQVEVLCVMTPESCRWVTACEYSFEHVVMAINCFANGKKMHKSYF